MKIPGQRKPRFIPTNKEETLTNQRKRVAKRLASGLLAGAVAFGGLALSGASPAGAVPIEEDADQRVAGSDRYATSSEVAETLESESGTDTSLVIVANGDNFPDALAASALTDSEHPILLVKANEIPSTVRDRMNRVADTTNDVLIIGGESAVSAAVYAEIEAIFEDADVARIAGDDRYSTAAEVAAEVGYADMVILTSGQSWPDAVTVGGYASTNAVPVLLANSSGLPSATSSALEDALDDGVSRVVIVGGPAAVGSGVEDDLVELGFDPAGISRIAGADRYQTNLLFNVEQFGDSLAKHLIGENDGLGGLTLMLVSGANFPDALTAAPLAAQQGAHLILVDPAAGGAAWLTLAGAGKTASNVDIAAAQFSSAALTDNEMISSSGYFGQSVWVVGGQSAVPSATIGIGTSVAAASLDCAVIVAGANAEVPDGPNGFIIAWTGDLSSSVADGALSNGEETVIDTDASMEALVDINGSDADIAATTLLDLNKNGNPDAVLVSLNAELEEDDEIEFLGWETDTEDYATSGTYLRDFNACSADVAADEDAPTADIYAEDGSQYVVVVFSEALSDDGTNFGAALEGDLDTSFSGGTGDEAFSCTNVDLGRTVYVCDNTAGTDAFGDAGVATITLTAATYYDAAGNEMAENATLDAADTVQTAPTIDSATVVCSTMGAGLDKATAWDDAYANAGAQSADSAAVINVTFADGNDLSISSESGVSGVSGNNWTFTVTHQRGLLRPTVSVDGTDVTITIDRYVHTVEDMERVINAQFNGGLASQWEADGSGVTAGELIDTDVLDESLTAENSGTMQTQTCRFEVTLTAATVDTLSVVTATPSAAGEIRITIDGVAQSAEIQYAGEADGGLTIEGVIWNTSDTGTAKVSTYVEDLSATNGELDTVTAS